MSFSDPRPLRDRLAAAAPTLLIQGAVGYALLTGLAVTVMRPEPRPFETTNVSLPPTPPPDPVEETPPAPRTAARPTPQLPDALPDAVPETAPDATEAPAGTGPVVLFDPGPLQPAQPPAPPPAPDLSRGAAPRGAQGDWFPQDAYPAAARRAGAEGRVSVTVEVGANGRVAACRVTASSGSEELDAATCRLASRNGRFTPALGRDGRPVAAAYALRNVRWVLEE